MSPRNVYICRNMRKLQSNELDIDLEVVIKQMLTPNENSEI